MSSDTENVSVSVHSAGSDCSHDIMYEFPPSMLLRLDTAEPSLVTMFATVI